MNYANYLKKSLDSQQKYQTKLINMHTNKSYEIQFLSHETRETMIIIQTIPIDGTFTWNPRNRWQLELIAPYNDGTHSGWEPVGLHHKPTSKTCWHTSRGRRRRLGLRTSGQAIKTYRATNSLYGSVNWAFESVPTEFNANIIVLTY